jgi:hypothetical protein
MSVVHQKDLEILILEKIGRFGCHLHVKSLAPRYAKFARSDQEGILAGFYFYILLLLFIYLFLP